jgi:hypothetical protein
VCRKASEGFLHGLLGHFRKRSRLAMPKLETHSFGCRPITQNHLSVVEMIRSENLGGHVLEAEQFLGVTVGDFQTIGFADGGLVAGGNCHLPGRSTTQLFCVNA